MTTPLPPRSAAGAAPTHGSRASRFKVAPVASFLKDAATAWVDDRASSMGAALAYYTLFSIAPMLLIVIAVVVCVIRSRRGDGDGANEQTYKNGF